MTVIPASEGTLIDDSDPVLLVDIVDVGHGSCVVVRSTDTVCLIDTGPGGAILEYLLTEDITSIDTIVVSHADADHIGGLSAILSQEIPVREIVWNPDALKSTDLWKDLVYQIADLHKAGATCATTNATQDTRIPVGPMDAFIAILAPGVALQHLGPGSTDRGGRKVTSNSSSVVAQIQVGDVSVALVPGDLDELGLFHLQESGLSERLRSHVLVLPHHGGHCGSPAATRRMITDLVAAVAPEAVFVSNGRGRYSNPRPEVVSAVREVDPHVKLACTQLNSTCSVLSIARSDSPSAFSSGWSRGHSCAGTMRVRVDSDHSVRVDRGAHDLFVTSSVAMPLC